MTVALTTDRWSIPDIRQAEMRSLGGVTVYFHTTDATEAILRDGFRDAEGTYKLVGFTLRGVFIADVPMDTNEGAKGEQLLEIVFPDDVNLENFELVEEGKPYREWCVPAELLNEHGARRLLAGSERDEVEAAQWAS
ncbi:hypothetical protein [Streptacidiphilus sp. EB129]|uniref:hypothetical protein n=1 Tax=Streptacidiphilus sp. EB129 TaxID=3156262 RepID=UPI003515E193